MAFAPTRSGKGVGLVVPTLLTWPSSAVIHDINRGQRLPGSAFSNQR
ncbi:MAG TPA: type IV secretory system conjugative DNA transfer family protein [Burkholderiales bacterium]|nr:type IV secretory system conjugative DNA transfer family protein [Burkholderiales bacterium]